MHCVDKRFLNTENLFPGFYTVRYKQKEQVKALVDGLGTQLEATVVLKRNIKSQNWTEISESLPIVLSLVQNTDEHTRYEALLAINYICINYSSKISNYLMFKELEPVCIQILESEYLQLRLEGFKFLSIVLEKKFAEEYIKYLLLFEIYLELHVDEEAMAYIMEMVILMFEKIDESNLLKLTLQVCAILRVAVEQDLVLYCLSFVDKALAYESGKYAVTAIQNKLGESLMLHIGNGKCLENIIQILKKLSNFPEVLPVFKDSLAVFTGLLSNSSDLAKNFSSKILLQQSLQGFEYLENMINKNFIPILVKYLTSDDKNIKKDMILIAKSFFQQQLQHQIIELLENNVVNVLCRVIERDSYNQLEALEAMECLLNCGNEIFKSFADSCKLSRLLAQVGVQPELNGIASRILIRHYPGRPLPQANNFGQLAPANKFNALNTNNQALNSQTSINNIPVTANLPAVSSNVVNPVPVVMNNTPNTGFFLPQNTAINTPVPIPKKNNPRKAKQPVRPKPAKTTGAGKGKSGLSSAVTIFPPSRFHKKLRSTKLRVSKKAAVFLCGVLDYLCQEVLDVSKTAVLQSKRKTITPKDILLAVRQDYELDKLLINTILPESGNCS